MKSLDDTLITKLSDLWGDCLSYTEPQVSYKIWSDVNYVLFDNVYFTVTDIQNTIKSDLYV